MTITHWFREKKEKRKKIKELEGEKMALLKSVPAAKMRRFLHLCREIKNGNGTIKKRKEVLRLNKEVGEIGLKKIAEKIEAIDKKIKKI